MLAKSPRVAQEIEALRLAEAAQALQTPAQLRALVIQTLVQTAIDPLVKPAVRVQAAKVLGTVVEVGAFVHRSEVKHISNSEDAKAKVLQEIKADNIPEIIAINKTDKISDETMGNLKRIFPEAVFVSAHSGFGIETLLKTIDDRLPDPSVEMMLTIPYSRGDLLARVHEDGKVLKTEHNDSGTQIHAFVPSELAHQLKQLLADEKN
jgi:GTP-binding protein HflX